MRQLARLTDKSRRTVCGVMSGTSLDGVDVAVVDIERTGDGLSLETRAFQSRQYPDELRQSLLRNSLDETASLEEITRLNFLLAHIYASTIAETLKGVNIDAAEVDLIGSHGQTVCHLPEPYGELPPATLQIGDPSVLANLIGIPVVGDFRVADMALGGQGAPLVPYFDYLMFRDTVASRGSLNLGGIANITLLKAGCGPDEVTAFDTGPANMVIDILARRLLGKPFDENGATAATGKVHEPTLQLLLEDPYFKKAPPKSTGREDYGDDYADRLLDILMAEGISTPADVLATATALTVRSIALAYEQLIKNECELDELIVAGGGQRNDHLMNELQAAFPGVEVTTTSRYGIDPDAKEAICFAVLANETIDGIASNVPSVTGARRSAILGKICIPS